MTRTRQAFDAYKAARAAAGLPPPGEDRFSYMAFCYVGDTDEEAHPHRPEDPLVPDRQHQERAADVANSSRAQIAAGDGAGGLARRRVAGGATDLPRCRGADRARARCSPATPTRWRDRSRSSASRVGGVGHIIMMTRQGLVTHAEAEKSFTRAARDVLPQLQDLAPIDADEAGWAARRPAAK